MLSLIGAFVLTGQPTAITPLTTGLAITSPGNRRVAIQVDPIVQSIVLTGEANPRYGDRIGDQVWAPMRADKDGVFTGRPIEGGYILCTFESPGPEIAILHAEGSSVSYVNGTPHVGDPYQTGMVTLPVLLKAGVNKFLFACGRGRLKAWIAPVTDPITVNSEDATLPDWLGTDSPKTLDAAVTITNATQTEQITTVFASDEAGGPRSSQIVRLSPLSVTKVPLRWQVNPKGTGGLNVSLQGVSKSRRFALRAKSITQAHKVTFRSDMDGSVQYFAILPARKPSVSNGLVLSLHGAGVEAIGQAEAYGPHDDFTIVCPTNRRPFGFDWEDEGMRDALEVLQIAEKTIPHAPRRVYLTGHSMGGHGTWSIGSLFPDRFAALAPSAGWISFNSYPSAGPAPVSDFERMLVRASAASDTLARKDNLMQVPIFALHGDADDNVPVTEMKDMVRALKGHPDLAFHIQKGAGHWWDVNPAPGADCVDWPGFFDLFKRTKLVQPNLAKSFEFVTPSPGISSQDYWLTVDQQLQPFEISSVRVRGRDIATSNVYRFSLALPNSPYAKEPSLTLIIDAQSLTVPTNKVATFLRTGKTWEVASAAPPTEKTPLRSGGFKDIFRHNFVFVYGTRGTSSENRWALDKARYDAETWWYRGNGTARVFADREFDPALEPDSNILLYGNANTNSLWRPLFQNSPVQLEHDKVTVGPQTIESDALALFLIRPRQGSSFASVAGIGGSGIVGMRMCDRVPIFTSGAGMPDFLVLSPETLSKGVKGYGLGGYFEFDWSLDPSRIVSSSSGR